LSCTLAAADELDAGLDEPDELDELLEPLELHAVIRTAALAAISGMASIFLRIIHSLLKTWSSTWPDKGHAVYSTIASVQRDDGTVLNEVFVNVAAPGEGFPCRLAKFLYMCDEQIRQPFPVVRCQAVPDATEKR